MARALRLLLCALGAAILASPPSASGQPASSWTAAERRVALDALNAGRLAGLADSALSDSRLEDAVVRYARQELGQRIRPSAVDPFWALEPDRRDASKELADARRDGRLAAWLDSLSPPFAAYRALSAARDRYRRIVEAGGWSPLPKGPAAKPGERSAWVGALRRRLAAEDFGSPGGADADLFDPGLRRALMAFQAAHELPRTGQADAVTRAALNVPAELRLAAIEANLERWRWLPHTLPPDRVELDIAGAGLRLIQGDQTTLAMRAVVGDPRHRTPMFASRLTAVVFDPPWNVPAEIAAKEILPKAAKDPGYLERNDFVMTDGRLVQQPGPKNALGQVKFDLPSPFGVYLHDTPAKSLFERRVRALSHGCMRLEKSQDLAEALLAPQGWKPPDVADALGAGRTRSVALQRSVPLYVVYWTVTVGDDGRPTFRPDVYGWDAELTRALAQASGPKAAGEAASAGCDVVSD